MCIKNKIIDFLKNKTAVVSIEFSLVLPVLLTLFFGTIEITNLIYAKQKAQSAVNMTQQLLTSQATLNDVQSVFNQVGITIVNEMLDVQVNNSTTTRERKKMGYVYNLIDKGKRIPDPTNQIDDNQLYVACQLKLRHSSAPFSEDDVTRFDYSRTGNPSDPVDKAYFDANKINKTDKVHRFVADSIGNINPGGSEQYVVIEFRMQYEPTFRITQSVVPEEALQFKIETAPMVASTRYTNLPNALWYNGDGGSLH